MKTITSEYFVGLEWEEYNQKNTHNREVSLYEPAFKKSCDEGGKDPMGMLFPISLTN